MPTPGFAYGGPVTYHPMTAVIVRNGTTTGLVPLHPQDVGGKTPINLAQGVYALHGNTLAATTVPATGEKWTVVKNPPRGSVTATAFATTTQPTRVSRTILSSSTGSRPVTISRDSSIVYDATQHRFVNNSNPSRTAVEGTKEQGAALAAEGKGAANPAVAAGAAPREPNVPGVAHGNNVPARPRISPPPPPASGNSGHTSGGDAIWNQGAVSSTNSSHTTSSTPAGHSGGGHH
jgi:hypothetical protein